MQRSILLALALLAVYGTALAPTARGQVAAPRPSEAEAQQRLRSADTTTTFLLRLRDGSNVTGKVRAVRGDSVDFASSVGPITLALASVTGATLVRPEDIRNGEYWFRNPNATRLLFAPTGRSLRKGEGYFSDYLLFFPGVAVGVTDRLTLGGGMSIFPGIGLDEQLLFFTPKLGVLARPELHVSVGALVMRTGFDDSESLGIVYTVGTRGGENGSVTGGIGVGYAGGGFADSPALMVGGERRVSRRVGLVSENYYFPGAFDAGLVSGGIRFFGEKMALDFGLVRTVGDSDGVTFPFVGFIVNF